MSEATDSFHINATIMNIKNDKKSVVSHNQTEMQIIARTGQLAAPTGNWGAGKTTVTIDLASNYKGEVWIAYNMELIENRQDGIIISGVRFIAAAAVKAEERDDEQPQDYEINPGLMAAIEATPSIVQRMIWASAEGIWLLWILGWPGKSERWI